MSSRLSVPPQLDLAPLCRKRLAQAARSAAPGRTRRQIRAAVSRFIRRHRRQRGYLRWVLRSVAANAGLALALLGLAPQMASAKATHFEAVTGAGNPLAGQNLGFFSQSTFGDLDGDGDLDQVAGRDAGVFFYFTNTGNATSPAFAPQTGAANPLAGQDVGYHSTPTLGDLDGDGDLDLVSGELFGTFLYYANTGSASSPAFALRTGTANPLAGQDVGRGSRPTLGDLDGDGDLDLVSGEEYGGFLYYENTGSATSPAFVSRTGTANPLDGQDVGFLSAPTLGDLDGDGDLDLVSGIYGGTFAYFQNTGSATSPAFVVRTGAASPLTGLAVGAFRSAPTLGDLDGDGDLDLVSGERFGTFLYYRNLATDLVPITGAANPLDGQDIGYNSNATLGDLDGDGDLDLVSGEQYGGFLYYANTGNATSPAFVQRTGAANPLDGQDAGYYTSSPTLGDLDRDGDLDLIAGESGGTLAYYENTGSPTTPAFVLRTGASNPLAGENVGSFAAPTLGDLDRDGDLDLVSGEGLGTFLYYENTGSAASPAFVLRAGIANPLDGQDVGRNSTPRLGDLDGDGDLDVVAGERYGALLYFENTGSATSPTFAPHTGTANPLAGQDVGNRSTPGLGDLDGDGDLDVVSGETNGTFFLFENAIVEPSLSVYELTGAANPLDGQSGGSSSTATLGDLDGDGDLDLVVGAYDGRFLYFRNTGTALRPEFVSATNPLAGQDVGFRSAPALADLDGDGDLDLVAGTYYGTFAYYKNTGSATSPAFALQTSAANPLNGQDIGNRSTPTLGDLDGDGDLDLVAGENLGVFFYFENTGTATSPAFASRAGVANPLDGVGLGFNTTAALSDLDGDGDLDLVAGESQGVFAFFENTGTAKVPAFVQRTGASNPLDGKTSGGLAAPALGDLDHDGDPDVVSGSVGGSFTTYYVPEPLQGLLLGAGAWLLGGLARIRRGRRRDHDRSWGRDRARR